MEIFEAFDLKMPRPPYPAIRPLHAAPMSATGPARGSVPTGLARGGGQRVNPGHWGQWRVPGQIPAHPRPRTVPFVRPVYYDICIPMDDW